MQPRHPSTITPIHSQIRFRASLTAIRSRKYLYFTACLANMLGFPVGVAFSWTSPVLAKLTDNKFMNVNPIGRLVTTVEASWIGSCLVLGGMFGSLFAGYSVSKIGRKKTMLINCICVYVIAFLILAFANNVPLYCIARFLAGTTLSTIYTVVPIYVAEVAEDSIRGCLCSFLLTFDTFGQLFGYTTGPYLSIQWFSITAACITAAFGVLVYLFLPESPYYLLTVKNRKAAEESLMKLRSAPREGVKTELDFLESTAEKAEKERGRINDLCKTKATRRAEIISIGLVVFQHCSGLVPILMYAQSIYNQTGSAFSPEVGPMITGTVQFLFSFVAPNVVDRLGRKWMLLISATGMLTAETFLGVYCFLKDTGRDVDHLNWAPVTCLMFFIITHIMGFGPLVWTIMGEVFLPNLKSAAFTVSAFMWGTMGFILSNVFLPLADTIGIAETFWIFAGCCFFAIIFISTFVVETKGKSFEEIQVLLGK